MSLVTDPAHPSRSSVVPAGRLVGQVLWDLGVRQVFGVVGSGNFIPTASLVGAGARFVGARHEGGAVTMADSYARVSGELAVCSVHQGPGLTNTLTGLVEAVKSRTPMLVLAGATSAGAIRSNFYVDQIGLVESAGAIAEQLYRPGTVVEDTVRAYRRAVVQRRPVVLNMPLDVQAALVEPAAAAPAQPVPPAAARPAHDVVARVSSLLSKAKRPLIIAGRGACVSDARDSLLQLGDAVGALFANTAVANGFFADSPWTVGIAGGFASDDTAALIAEADVVVGFGCSFTVWTTRHGRLFNPHAVVVQVDTDPMALGETARVDVGVLGDANETARAVLAEVSKRGAATTGWRTDELAARIVELGRRVRRVREDSTPGGIHPEDLTLTLDEMLPRARTVVIDGGHFIGWPATCLSVPDPQGFVFSSAGFQSIGLGLAAVIGAQVGRPDRLAVLAAGDGGFLMSVSELETLARLDLPVLVVVYNDAAYSAEVHHFSAGGEGMELVRFPETDIAALARGAGANGVTVRQLGDLEQVGKWLEKPAGPMVVDARIDRTVVGYWAEQDFQGH